MMLPAVITRIPALHLSRYLTPVTLPNIAQGVTRFYGWYGCSVIGHCIVPRIFKRGVVNQHIACYVRYIGFNTKEGHAG